MLRSFLCEVFSVLIAMGKEKDAKSGKTVLAWDRLKESVSNTEPKDLVKFVIISLCILLVYLQVMSCFYKLHNPSVVSHTSLKLNETLHLPALTICREPPLNRRYFNKYKIDTPHLYSVPIISQYVNFPFDTYTIADFYNDSVYKENILVSYGQREKDKTKLVSSVYMTLGMCHTLIPSGESRLVGKMEGLSATMQHDLYDYKPVVDSIPGWYIYLHEPREKFSENAEILAGRQDYIFVGINENVDINLSVMEFRTVQNCNNSHDYSATRCEELCWVKEIFNQTNCTGPWLPYVGLPDCNSHSDLSELFSAMEMKNLNCCLPHCLKRQFTPSVVSRTSLGKTLQSSFSVYFTSKSVLTMEESFDYDWNLFLADLGGSLGFLLGLSVIGIIGFLEEIVKFIWGGRSKTDKIKEVDQSSVRTSVVGSDYKWRFDTPFKISPPVAAKIDRYY